MTRGRIGTLSLHSCGSFIRYSPPALTDAFPVPFSSLFPDNLGTIRDVAQFNSGTGVTSITDHLKYDSFGNITAQSNSANQPLFAFTGMLLVPETGLYYDHARWYDPHTGRFLSQDPTGFGAGDPNLYRYVGNGSTNFIDPSGLRDQRVTNAAGVDAPLDLNRFDSDLVPFMNRMSPGGSGSTTNEDPSSWDAFWHSIGASLSAMPKTYASLMTPLFTDDMEEAERLMREAYVGSPQGQADAETRPWVDFALNIAVAAMKKAMMKMVLDMVMSGVRFTFDPPGMGCGELDVCFVAGTPVLVPGPEFEVQFVDAGRPSSADWALGAGAILVGLYVGNSGF